MAVQELAGLQSISSRAAAALREAWRYVGARPPVEEKLAKLDFLIPGSPNDAFYSQIAFFRLALDSLGGAFREARVVAVLAAEVIVPLPSHWAKYYERIEVEWADPAEFRRLGHAAPGDRRFQLFRSDADLVVFCDADTVMMRAWPGVASCIARKPALAGVIAHYHFPWSKSTGVPARDWQIFAREILGREIALDYQYTLQDPTFADRCPFYINFGFFAGPPELISKFYATYRKIRPEVARVLENHFCGQLALALAIADLKAPVLALPMRYNFPNDERADRMYPRDVKRITLLHYLRNDRFDRHIVFTGQEQFHSFLSLELQGSNAAFQQFVARLTAGRYPFSR
jgi:hypothetical protein